MTIPAGTLVPRDARDFGNYQLIAKLATGGMAEIFLARPTGSKGHDDVLVLKRILPHLAEDEHFVTMFRDEADLAAQLVHRNVCHVEKFGEYAGTWFIAMEYLHGVPLSRMMTRLSKAGKMLEIRVVAGIIIQACEGLHSAHEARGPDGALLNVVHRDVSPPNMMLCADGMVKLLDFGIAKARGANSRTRTGTVKGKNAYMSPEQILGKPLDRRSDVFALAIVMFEMLAIKRLFHRDSDFLTFKAITEEPIPEIRDRRPDVPPGMRTALLQAMARDPSGRFDTAQAFANAIRASVATLGGPATPQELARLLFTDFGDEMAARDEILKAADELATQPQPALPPPPPKPVAVAKPPPIPIPAQSGELSQRAHRPTGPLGSVPSMIIQPPTGKVTLVEPEVVDLSASMQPDTWMAEPDTNILRGHRWKSLRNTVIALVAVAAVCVAIMMIVKSSGGDKDAAVAAPVADAAVKKAIVDPPPDAFVDDGHDTIAALSHYGYFSLSANSQTTIYIDGRNMGDTPMKRVPLPPGPHKIHAVGPKGKTKDIKTTIYGGKDTDEGIINW